MKTIVRQFAVVAALSLFSLTTGCTVIIKNPKAPFGAYPPVEKLDLKVGLNVTDDLRKPEFKKDGLVIRPGDYLATNSAMLAKHVFREVTPATSGEAPGLDAVLTPKLVYVNRTRGATSFGESITSVKVEWNLSDANGKPVWLETVTGEGRGSTGWTAPEKPLKQALDELLLKSQQAISGAEAIRSFTTRRKTAKATP